MAPMVNTARVAHPRSVMVQCLECGRVTNHDILKEFVDSAHMIAPEITVEDTYQIVRCRGCETISFRHSWWSDDEFDEEGDPIVRAKVYPYRVPGLKEIEGQQYLPDVVREIYRETLIALRTGEGSTLGAMGIRAIIEAVCKDRQAPGRTLEEKINGLVQAHWLTSRQSEFLHKSRLLGNIAAHEMKRPSPSTLGTAWRIVENLLETVYVLPALKSRMKT